MILTDVSSFLPFCLVLYVLIAIGQSQASEVFCQRSGDFRTRSIHTTEDVAREADLAHHRRLWEETGARTLDEFMERVDESDVPYLTRGPHGIRKRVVEKAHEERTTDGHSSNTSSGHTNTSTADQKDHSTYANTCSTPHTVCAILRDGIQYSAGPTPYKIKHTEHATVLFYWYWQATVLLVGPGGSANYYPAHGCIHTCVKGTMAAHYLQEPDVEVRGDVDHPDVVNCINPTNLENEMVFWLQK